MGSCGSSLSHIDLNNIRIFNVALKVNSNKTNLQGMMSLSMRDIPSNVVDIYSKSKKDYYVMSSEKKEKFNIIKKQKKSIALEKISVIEKIWNDPYIMFFIKFLNNDKISSSEIPVGLLRELQVSSLDDLREDLEIIRNFVLLTQQFSSLDCLLKIYNTVRTFKFVINNIDNTFCNAIDVLITINIILDEMITTLKL